MKTTIKLTGDKVECSDAIDLSEKLEKLPRNTKVTLDIEGVKTLSVAAIGVLVWAITTFKKVTLVDCNILISKKLQILGLTQLLIIK